MRAPELGSRAISFAVDSQGWVTEANSALTQALGAELLGCEVADVLASPTPDELARTAGWIDCQLRATEGAPRDAVVNGREVSSGRRYEGMFIASSPVTSGPSARLARVLEASPDALMMMDMSLYVTGCNRSWEQLFGFPARWALGRHLTEMLINPEIDEFIQDGLLAVYAGRTSHSVQRLSRFDGPLIDISILVSPIHDSERNPVGVSIVSRDVSEQVVSASELRERTSELERSRNSLQLFMTSASHDLREPLNALVLCAQLLGERSRERLGPIECELLDSVISQSQEAHQRLIELLNPESLTPGREIEPYSASAALEAAQRTLLPQINSSNAAIQASALPLLNVDCAHQTIIFQNLLSNALRYASPMRPPRISVQHRPIDDDELVCIEFTDNGIGIPESKLDSIFEPFKSLPGSAGGLGVGLALVRRIVEEYDGEITVASSPDSGTSFQLTLPAAPAPSSHQ